MKPEVFFEAVVVGAGPAGSIAAYEIARAGFSVLLVEKHPVIGVPVCCGEAITHEGLTQVLPLDSRWVACDVSGVILVSPGGQTVDVTHPDAGYILDRKTLDHDLAQRAAEAGATVWVNTEAVGLDSDNGKTFDGVVLRREGKVLPIGCRIILGCDGIESLVGRWAGLNTIVSPEAMDSSAQYLLGNLKDLNPDKMVLYFSSKLAPGGYAWIFPKSTTTANVGLGLTPSLADGKSPVTRLDKFVARHFGSAAVLEKTAGGIPAFRGRKMMLRKNVLLAGDAARLVDSLTGAGIAHALLSGQYAGHTAAEYLREKEPKLSILKAYPDRFMKHKGRELRYALYARQIFMRMTDRDFDDVIGYLKPIYDGKTLYDVDSTAVIKSILRARPRLLALARHLIW